MYHYTASGLDNVWLKNGYQVKTTRYGEGVSIEDADGLHQAIAHRLIDKKGQLTGKEFRFLRVTLGMSQEGLAALLDVQAQSVSLWERKGTAPKSSEALLRLLAQEHFDGNGSVSEMIERINMVDRLMNQAIVAKESQRKWTAKAKPMPSGLEAAA